MSTTYLTHRKRPFLAKAISSASLDALMLSTDSNDKDKSSPEKHNYPTKAPIKRPADCDDKKLTSTSIRFTPPQLRKGLSTNSNEEDKTSPEKHKYPTKISSKGHATYDDNKSTSKNTTVTPPELRKTKSTLIELTPKRDSPELNSPSESTPNCERKIITIVSDSDGRYSTSSSEKRKSSSLDTSFGSESLETSQSSLYSTPGNKSSVINTPEHSIRPWKRSSGSESRLEDPSSTSSSPSYSSYHTPESSFCDWGSATKRRKTRWNDSSINLSDSINSEYFNESFKSRDSLSAIQPELIGYQLIGDSQFCRFGQQILGLQRVSMPNCPGRIGFCVSGQTISDLHRRVKEKFYPISDKIILMIGTNDFLRNLDVTIMCRELSELIRTLQQSASNIVLLTLPPIPKLEQKSLHHFKVLDKYNRYIRNLEDGDKIRIADISPLYMSSPPYQRCRMQLFEIYFAGAARRHDLIHLNRQGLEVIHKYILDTLL